MSIHSFAAQHGSQVREPMNVGLTFQYEPSSLADLVLKTRAIRALEGVATRYPIYRDIRCAARRKLEDVFDDLALTFGYPALRLDEGTLLLDGPDAFVQASGWRKAHYCSCSFDVWTESQDRLEQIRTRLLQIVGERYARDHMFTIEWYFNHPRVGLHHASFDELADDNLIDEAYPTLGMSARDFANAYLNANETVLILQGPPGTGKTRLVRAILSMMSARKADDSARVMYTADKQALEKDEIFVNFITGEHDAFVIEDADHLLLARSSGNHDLHRFLAIADGVVRAQGRKIIFTTNLPNISDIDDALLRPGRCFGTVRTRGLQPNEAAALVARLVDDPIAREPIFDRLYQGRSSVTVAEIYRACGTSATIRE